MQQNSRDDFPFCTDADHNMYNVMYIIYQIVKQWDEMEISSWTIWQPFQIIMCKKANYKLQV